MTYNDRQLFLASRFEQEGEYEQALEIYRRKTKLSSVKAYAWNRIRIISVKQKNWIQAVEACQELIECTKKSPLGSREFEQHLIKYQGKLGIGIVSQLTSKIILKKAIQGASEDSYQKYKNREIANIELYNIDDEIPSLLQYNILRDSMTETQKTFYYKWFEHWKEKNPIKINGNIGYLYVYLYLLFKDMKNKNHILRELFSIYYAYKEENIIENIYAWITSVLFYESRFLGLYDYFIHYNYRNIQEKRENIFDVDKVLSLKYKYNFPLSGYDSYYLYNSLIILPEKVNDKKDVIIEYLENKIRNFENKHDVDLLSIITEQYAIKNQNYDKNLKEFIFYRYKNLGDFDIVIEEWMKEAENLVRDKLNIPRIGEGWISETILYNMVKDICDRYNIEAIHHSRPPFLGGQELDIYIPDLKIAFEYQGRQHYEPIDFFGGDEGYNYRKNLDKRKKQLCDQNNIMLIEIRYDEEISIEKISKILIEKLNRYPEASGNSQ